MSTLVVTGAGGWLGRNFLKFVGSSFRVKCLLAPWENEGFLGRDATWVKGNIENPADCERLLAGCEGGDLVHLAGVIHPQRVKQFYTVNVEGTNHLLKAAQKVGIRRAVVMSSNSPTGVNPSREHLFDEQSPYNPYMHYGRSKRLMEQCVKNFALETVILRSPWFYGPHQPSRQSLFFQMVRDGRVPLVGDGMNRRSMAYVDHISQGIVKALQTPGAAGQTYWIADAQPYTMHEILKTIETVLEECGIPCLPHRIRLPSCVSSIAYAVDKCLQSVGLYHQKIHVLSEMDKTIACSVEKARRELGFNPDISFQEGMRRSVQWAIQQGQLEKRV